MDQESNRPYHLNKIKMVYEPRDIEEKELEGFCVANPGYTIGINIFMIWDDVIKNGRIKHKENTFIRRFAQTTTHEYLHRECEEAKAELFEVKEEELIRKMMGESWNDKIKKDYDRRLQTLPY